MLGRPVHQLECPSFSTSLSKQRILLLPLAVQIIKLFLRLPTAILNLLQLLDQVTLQKKQVFKNY